MIFCTSIFCTMDMYLYQLELMYFGHDSLGFCTCTYTLSIPLLMFMIFEYHFNAIYVYPRQCMYGVLQIVKTPNVKWVWYAKSVNSIRGASPNMFKNKNNLCMK